MNFYSGLFLGAIFSFTSACSQSVPTAAAQQGDAALVPPIINTSPLPTYNYAHLDYGMNIGIERTKRGKIWACWVGGGDNEDAFLVLNKSSDGGNTWTSPKVVIDPHRPSLKIKRRALLATLWLDPQGRLWLFFDQGMTYFDGRSGVWYTICKNPDDENPTWTAPVRIWHGCTLNKPIVLSNGSWLLPVSLWDRGKIKDSLYKDSFRELDSLRMANVFISKDKGVTWERQGGVRFPEPKFDEHHIVERKDGSLWMTARTNDGIWQSVSTDQGKNWSAPQKYLEHISSRHFIRRLQSGRLLLVKHGELDERTETRSKLMAFLSDDDGKTWQGGLMLDERRGVSYPDGFQAPDGVIYISYDHNRATDGEILLAKFTEQDIVAKKFISKQSKAGLLISRPTGLDKLPAPSTILNN